MSVPELRDAGYVAERFGVSTATAMQWFRSGRLRAAQFGRRWKTTDQAIAEFIEGAMRCRTDHDPDESGGTGSAGATDRTPGAEPGSMPERDRRGVVALAQTTFTRPSGGCSNG